jgi:hypothetical protein
MTEAHRERPAHWFLIGVLVLLVAAGAYLVVRELRFRVTALADDGEDLAEDTAFGGVPVPGRGVGRGGNAPATRGTQGREGQRQSHQLRRVRDEGI